MKNEKAFTLIEVLIALAIVAIALTAIVKATSSNINQTILLRNNAVANWVAIDAIHKIQLGLIAVSPGSHIKKTTKMLGENWPWNANVTNTPDPNVLKISVTVFNQQNKTKVIAIHGYKSVIATTF